MPLPRSTIQHGLATMVSASALLSIALWNGFPLVYSDTSTYLSSGFVLDTPIDRPITYGLFLRVCSLDGWSLWGAALAQSMLLAYLMGLFMRQVGIASIWHRTGAIVLTVVATGLPFVSGQLITDVFTPILFLSLFLVLWPGELGRVHRVAAHLLFLLAFAMHMSHIGITAVVLAGVLVLRPKLRTHGLAPAWQAMGRVLLLALAGSFVMGPSLAKSKNTFFAARMAEHGILQRYLEKNCATEPLLLCQRVGSIPHSADAFLWADDRALSVYPDRATMEAELGGIRSASFRDGELLGMHLLSTVRAVGRQLFHFAVGDGNGSFGSGTLLHERLVHHVPGDGLAYGRARQMDLARFTDTMRAFNAWYHAVMLLCALTLLIIVVLRYTALVQRSWLALALLYLLGAYVLNAAVNAGLVMVADRFGTKMAWTVPFACILVLWGVVFKGGCRRVPVS